MKLVFSEIFQVADYKSKVKIF